LRKPPNEQQKKLVAGQASPVPLRVAASVVHQQLGGTSRQEIDGSYNAILDSTALALSHVCDIYAVNAQGKLSRIPESELTIGAFEDGAKRFRAHDGTVYESLSIRRGDMADAIEILRKARNALRPPAREPRERESNPGEESKPK
jgi:hypothetical protein